MIRGPRNRSVCDRHKFLQVGHGVTRSLFAILLVFSLGIPAHAIATRAHRFNWLLGISPSTDDFIREVALGELFEMELNKAAVTKGNAKTKAFAAAMP